MFNSYYVLDFCFKLFSEINLCRKDPKNYALKLDKHRQYIMKDTRNTNSMTGSPSKLPESPTKEGREKYIYQNKWINGPRVLLNHGESKLDEFIQFLQTMSPLPELTYNDKLCILKLNDIKSDSWHNKEDFSKLVKEKKNQLKTNNLNFLFDIGYNDVETCAMLMLIDDNKMFKGKRRDYLLDPKAKEIGICNKLDCRKNCAYILVLYSKDDK